VLWPNLSTWWEFEKFPFLRLTPHYLYPSEERSHRTRWPLIIRFNSFVSSTYPVALSNNPNSGLEPFTKSLSIFSKNINFKKIEDSYVYLPQEVVGAITHRFPGFSMDTLIFHSTSWLHRVRFKYIFWPQHYIKVSRYLTNQYSYTLMSYPYDKLSSKNLFFKSGWMYILVQKTHFFPNL